MISTFLAGHENPQLVLISALFLLAEHPNIQESLRAEITSLDSSEPAPQTLASLPLLNAVIYEVLRLYPPISQLINRQTKSPILLGGEIPIPSGTYLGYNAYSTNRDIKFWGASADEFKPERWGSNMDDINGLFRRANAKGAFISFHGGRRACLGQKFAMLEARIALVALLGRVRWELDPGWPRMMTPVCSLLLVFRLGLDWVGLTTDCGHRLDLSMPETCGLGSMMSRQDEVMNWCSVGFLACLIGVIMLDVSNELFTVGS